MTIEEQIVLMKHYAQMMLERGDYHGLWDAAIDLQRLQDKLDKDHLPDASKKVCVHCFHLILDGDENVIVECANCGDVHYIDYNSFKKLR